MGSVRHYINPKPTELPKGAPVDVVHADFGGRLQQAMVAKGWNQSELARRANERMPEGQKMGRDNVSGYIRGTTLPGPVKLKALADALGMTVEELLPQRGVPNAGNKTIPALDMRDLGDGNVWLRVNQAVPRNIALRVMNLLMAGEEAPVGGIPSGPKKRRQMEGDQGEIGLAN